MASHAAHAAAQGAVPAALKPADERGQRLFDQVVRLHRRALSGVTLTAEPFRSLLTEIALYHDEEEATFLKEGQDAKGRERAGPLPMAPWALYRLALQDRQLGDDEEALVHFHELGERFSGQWVMEPAEGPDAKKEKAESLSLDGEISSALKLAGKAGTKDVADTLETRIDALQEKFGHDSGYGLQALQYLWRALELDKANYKTWRKATLRFSKRERPGALKAKALWALSQGCEKLGKKEDAAEFQAMAAKESAAPPSDLPQGIFKNLIQP